jgi:predicted nucleic acid-binding Zn ribbon protein
MPVALECNACGHRHTIPERTDDPDDGTVCPACGATPYTVRRNGISWHPSA